MPSSSWSPPSSTQSPNPGGPDRRLVASRRPPGRCVPSGRTTSSGASSDDRGAQRSPPGWRWRRRGGRRRGARTAARPAARRARASPARRRRSDTSSAQRRRSGHGVAVGVGHRPTSATDERERQRGRPTTSNTPSGDHVRRSRRDGSRERTSRHRGGRPRGRRRPVLAGRRRHRPHRRGIGRRCIGRRQRRPSASATEGLAERLASSPASSVGAFHAHFRHSSTAKPPTRPRRSAPRLRGPGCASSARPRSGRAAAAAHASRPSATSSSIPQRAQELRPGVRTASAGGSWSAGTSVVMSWSPGSRR